MTPTPYEPDRRAAVVGLGSMGGAMAAHLVRAGWSVAGFDPDPAARAAAAAEGVDCADTVDALAGTPYVVLSLPSAAVVSATVPVLLSRRGTRVVVDTTTSDPATTQAMAELARTRAVAFVDAPVSGGRAGAGSGTMTAFVGADADAASAAEPLLDALTSTRHVVGSAGCGNVVKLLNNVLCATNLIAVGEALDIAAAYNIDLRATAAAISSASGGSAVSAGAFPSWILSGTFDSGFALGLMARDVDLALQVGAARGVQPALLTGTGRAWRRALEQLGPAADFTEAPATATTRAPGGTPA